MLISSSNIDISGNQQSQGLCLMNQQRLKSIISQALTFARFLHLDCKLRKNEFLEEFSCSSIRKELLKTFWICRTPYGFTDDTTDVLMSV